MNHRTWLIPAAIAVLALSGCDLFASPEARIERAAQHMAAGDYATAVIELKNALEKQPENARGRLLLAEASIQLGDMGSAEKELKRARDAGAKPADVVPVEARLYADTGDYQVLAKAMAAPIEGFDEADRLDYLGVAQLGLGDKAAAMTSLDAALARKPTGEAGSRIRTDHARALATNGNTDQAMKEVDAVLAAQPGYAPAAMLKSSLLIARGDMAGAEKVLASVPLDDPKARVSVRDQMMVLGSLTETRLAQDKVKEAGASADQLVKVAPGSPAAALMKGRVALAAGDYTVAVNQLQKAVQRSPDFVYAHYSLAVAYTKQGNNALAEQELQQVLQLSPDNVAARKLLAENQIRAGRADSAIESLQPLLASNTTDPAVYALVGQARMLEGNDSQAESALEQGMKAAPDSAELKLSAAAGYLATGDRDRALELLAQVPDEQGGVRKRRLQVIALASGKDKAVARLEIEALAKRNPKDAELQALAGAWLASQGDYAAAESYLNKALALAPNDGRVLLGLSQLAAQRGDAAASKKWLEEWHKRDPKSPDASLRLAKLAFASGDEAGGEKFINEAIAATPNSAVVEDMAGRVLLEAHRNDESLKHFAAAAKIEPTNKIFLFDMARAQMALSQHEAARSSLQKALAQDANWAPGIMALAQLEVADGKTADALELAGRLKKANPSSPAGLALEGDIYMASKQFDQAVGSYAAGYKLRPSAQLAIGEYRARRAAGKQPYSAPLDAWLKAHGDDAGVRAILAESLQRDGDDKGAIREYERLLVASPDNVLVLNNLAVLYQQSGDLKRAADVAKRAYDKAPKAPAILDTYGWILLQAGDAASGLKLLRQAADIAKNVPEIQYHLGVALARTGDKAEARKVLESAIAAAGADAGWKADAGKELASLK